MGLLMLFVLTPGTAEYVISAVTLALGIIFGGIVFILVRFSG
jgi:hypothetical protein